MKLRGRVSDLGNCKDTAAAMATCSRINIIDNTHAHGERVWGGGD